MNIVVVGAGAIGLLVASRLAQSSQQVALLARPAIAAVLAQQPIQVAYKGQVEQISGVRAISDAAEIKAPELAILAVKGYDTVGALATLELLRPQRILTLQNGIGNEETLAQHFGAERIISGTITTSVEVEGPGSIAVTKVGGIGLAALQSRADIASWATLFQQPEFVTRTYRDYRAMKWSKTLINMLGNASAAILDTSVEAVYADRRLVVLERQAFLEALQVMDRLGIRPVNLPRYPVAVLAQAMRMLPVALLDPLLRRFVAGGRGGKPPSLQLDLARGNRRSEGAFLYSAVAQAGAQVGVDTPVNRSLWSILQDISTGNVAWSEYQRQPERLIATVQHTRSSEVPH